MPTPSVSANVATTHNWVSSMDATLSVLEPSVGKTLTQRYGLQDMTGLIEMWDGGLNKVPVGQLYYDHFEEDWLHSIVKLDANGGGGAGASVTLTVAAAYQYSYPSTAQTPYIVTGATNTMPLLNGQEIQFPNGVQARVTGITYSAGTFVATPKVTGESIPAVLTTDEIIVIGNSHNEQSGQPGSRNSRVFRYRNNLQIQKWDSTTSGSAMGERIWFEIPASNGMPGGYLWMFKAQQDEFKRAKNEQAMTFLTGVKTTNTTLANIAGQEQNVTTEGLIPFVTNFGNVDTYNLVPGITLDDWETYVTTKIDKFRGAMENGVGVSINLRRGMEAFIRDNMKNGAISYGMFNGDKQKYIDFGFDSFQTLGYTFHMKTLTEFNYPNALGAAGQAYANMGIVFPMERGVANLGAGKEKTIVPPMRINYMSSEGSGSPNGRVYSRQWEEWYTGAANGIYTGTTDEVAYHMRSHWGAEFFAPNRWLKITGV